MKKLMTGKLANLSYHLLFSSIQEGKYMLPVPIFFMIPFSLCQFRHNEKKTCHQK